MAAVGRCIRARGSMPSKQAILVVEDHDPTREIITELLQNNGYVVETASDGAQARASVAMSSPALVILDLLLPEVSGFDLISEWRSKVPSRQRGVPRPQTAGLAGGLAPAIAACGA